MAPVSREYSVYVIRLRVEILAHARVRRANPGHVPGTPCVYVGSTHLTPEARYARHLDPTSKVGSRWVRRYSLRLHTGLTSRQPRFATRAEAEAHECHVAEMLRARGYAVCSG